MTGDAAPRPIAGLLPRAAMRAAVLAAALLVSACAGHHRAEDSDDNGINTYPANYKADILGAMHAYFNDPTGIRDTGISEPEIKTVGKLTRYVVCLRFNGKRKGNEYAGVKQVAAVFLAGRFDQFVEQAREVCDKVAYVPFPELEKLPR
jgi:hypothetical protein